MPHSIIPCPHCGGDIDADASVCRHCGSSESDGWREHGMEADAYEDDFDYDEFVRDQLSDSTFSTNVSPLWRWIALIMLVFIGGFILLSILQLFQ